MNRFDASTIWNSARQDSSESGEHAPSEESEPTALESSWQSELTAAGEVDSSSSGWSAALRAQTFFVPMHYEPNYRYPLIVWLHSDGFNENQACHVMPHVSTRNYVATGIRGTQAIDASGHRYRWSDSDSAMQTAESAVLEAIERTRSQFSIHPDRVVLAGYREGGTLALQLAMQRPRQFAAAVSLGGPLVLHPHFPPDRNQLISRRLPMLWQRALHSRWYDEAAMIDEIKLVADFRPQLEVRQYRNDDEMNTAVLSDFDRWIMEHVVSGAPVAKMHRWDTSPTSFSDN
jgi:phospholipase/carboxylesterase